MNYKIRQPVIIVRIEFLLIYYLHRGFFHRLHCSVSLYHLLLYRVIRQPVEEVSDYQRPESMSNSRIRVETVILEQGQNCVLIEEVLRCLLQMVEMLQIVKMLKIVKLLQVVTMLQVGLYQMLRVVKKLHVIKILQLFKCSYNSTGRGTEGKLVGGASWCLRYKITMRSRKTV